MAISREIVSDSGMASQIPSTPRNGIVGSRKARETQRIKPRRAQMVSALDDCNVA